MEEKIELLGFKGKITGIVTRSANPPFREEESLAAAVEFEEPLPSSILETWIYIPVKNYSKEELLVTVKRSGEQQLAVSIERHEKAKKHREEMERRKDELEQLTADIESKFK